MRWLTGYWGKAMPHDQSGARHHLLTLHSLDVAASLQALLDARPKHLGSIAVRAAVSAKEARALLTLSAALHDLGKYACAFQAKVPELWMHAHTRPQGAPSDHRGHGAYGPALWKRAEEEANLTNPGLRVWLDAGFAHHGRPIDKSGAGLILSDVMCAAAMQDAVAFALAMLERFGPAPNLTKDGAIAAEFEVAGLIAVADWLGSNQTWFGYRNEAVDLDMYWADAQRKAHDAVKAFGLQEGAPAPHFDLAAALQVEAADPSPLQAAAATLPLASGPALYVLEDLTGAGKTEAALLLAHRLMADGRAEGLYWALPTMATANGLFERLQRSYRHLFAQGEASPSLVLAHGRSKDHPGFRAIIQPDASSSVYEDEASAICAAWLAQDGRRSLFAQIGVGTIDQALLAALPVKHQAMRAAALARRVLVVDEAHAYDPYMTKGLEHLLGRHIDSGGSAIVLSATLPLRLRRDLAAAVRPVSAVKPPLEGEAPFPAATTLSANNREFRAVAPARGTRRDLSINRLSTVEEAVSILTQAARAGQCVVWVRNAVQDALDGAKALRDAVPEATVDVFHARFALVDRVTREADVLGRFGKRSTPDDRKGRILVATQVVEQSLDLDFDVMVTDLAPIDLLIQRAGRLHRHDHRPLRPSPILHVLGPTAEDGAGADWLGPALRRAGFVYPHHAQLWLTMRELETHGLQLLSRSPRAPIEAVYGAAAPEPPTALVNKSIRAEAKAYSDRAVAGQNFLKRHGAEGEPRAGRFLSDAGAWSPEIHTPTRLGELTATLRLARLEQRRLSPWAEDPDEARAWRLSEVSVRVGQIGEIRIDDTAVRAAVEAQAAKDNKAFDAPIYVPLDIDADGSWTSLIALGAGGGVALKAVYSPGKGLEFVAL